MAKEFFNEQQQKEIVAAIKEAEKNTSGEIKVHIEKKCKSHVLDRASEVFSMLNMHKTKLRNGVLFYLAVEDHRFAVLGDAGINIKVPADFWDSVKEAMQTQFRQGNFTEGLRLGIIKAGEKLKEHFPYQSDDINEISDDISFSNE